jgi:hypothetical protein
VRRLESGIHPPQHFLRRDPAVFTLGPLDGISGACEEGVLGTPPGDAIANARGDEIGEGLAFVEDGLGIASQRGLDTHGRESGGLHARNVMQM